MKAYRIIDNKVSELAEWDPELLSLELGELSEFSLDGFGLDFAEDTKFRATDIDVTDAELSELPEVAQTASGDLWQMGQHRVLCGDATSDIDCYHLFKVPYGGTAPRLAALVVTDPPYGVSYSSKNEFLDLRGKGNCCTKAIANDSLSGGELRTFLEKAFLNMHRFTLPKSVYYITAPQGAQLLYEFFGALIAAGYQLKHMLIWSKNNHVLGRCDYHYKHEPILYGWKDKETHHFYGGSNETSVWEIPKPLSSTRHPTTKPVALYLKALENSSQPGDILLEPFLGSGTGLIAAHRANRVCYGVESDPTYCDVICQRYYDETGDVPVTSGGKRFEPVAATLPSQKS